MDRWRWLLGRPLKTDEATTEEIGTSEGLAALSLDALTSVAYGPEAIALVLVGAGVAGLRWLVPVTAAIVALLAILVISYSQVIEAYPQGGGAYAVARENLGAGGSQVAAAALIVDYTLTVAISIAAGVGALTSAWPALQPWTVPLCLGVLAVLTVLNLRGVGESARAFLLPTVVFIVGLLAVVGWGLLHPVSAPAGGRIPPVAPRVGLFFLAKAFAAGLTALTGVEAIANGVPLFREPRVMRARRTEWLLGGLLGALLLGLAVLTIRFGVVPGGSVMLLSKVIIASVGHQAVFWVLSIDILVVLGLAANTSFGGLPVLASLLARDGYLPQGFAVRGDRLVFVQGIWVLASAAALLLVAVGGNPQALIPMFAIGVFTGFTLSQAGMVVHWWRTRPAGWPLRAALNGIGAALTGMATGLFILTKFAEGAWLVVCAIPLLIGLFHWVHRYYDRLARGLRTGQMPAPLTAAPKPLVVVPLFPTLSTLTERALAHALSLSDDVVAVVVEFQGDGSAQQAQALEAAWQQWHPPVRLVRLKSQYHSVVRPLVRFIQRLDRRSGARVVVLIPTIVPGRWSERLLHNHLANAITAALQARTDVVIGTVPMHLPDPVPPGSPP